MKFQKIEDLRIDHDLTQQQVADYLGCQREVYRRYEKGTRDIPIDFAIKLCDLYKVSLDYLVGRSSKR
ncbi:MAG: helix-turn-helix transcriptional regulator [Lachnospiraceae bacterium]|jgi:transcriptional regulator with XRE-family HTH domain|nr:helix-turn-helix transcriptional regulator [Lachnospiraceae bacterium]MDD5955902.1 helix-turn-helix transcriptional regulator [Lachnospiraceae bacterium]MDD6551813.1 helix-turn-helix transcriptional regulator [Lachnospiraceae bacterium]MDY3990262.1 helix-turn-helix transcriptional regulator [Lachnospiraceae bacterium]